VEHVETYGYFPLSSTGNLTGKLGSRPRECTLQYTDNLRYFNRVASAVYFNHTRWDLRRTSVRMTHLTTFPQALWITLCININKGNINKTYEDMLIE
jgi:hypothetical protein